MPMCVLIREIAKRHINDESGAVLAETIIVVPVIVLFAFAIFEFGSMLWQKEQMETGLRDAARYVARCQTSSSFGAACNNSMIAPNIAVYGIATTTDLDTAKTAPPRVPGWKASDVTITSTPETEGVVINAGSSIVYKGSPMFGVLGLSSITIEAYHEERYIGW